MPTEKLGMFHMGVGLDYCIDLILKERDEGKKTTEFANPPNQDINKVLSELFGLCAKGMTMWPVCDHYDAKGACLGHKD